MCICPGQCGSVGCSLYCKLKYHEFTSLSGHMLGCRFGPQLGCVQETTNLFLSLINISLPLYPFLLLSLKLIGMSLGKD